MKPKHPLITTTIQGVVFLLVFIFESVQVNAQLQLGLLGGINFDQHNVNGLMTPNTSNPAASTGSHFGLFCNTSLASRWDASFELGYIRRGARSVYPWTPVRRRTTFEYLHVPVLLGFEITKILIVEAGPSVDVEAKVFGSSDNSEHGKDLQFGINAGLRFNFHPRIFFLCRYYNGVTPFEKVAFNTGPNNSFQGGASYFHRTLQMSLAYNILTL